MSIPVIALVNYQNRVYHTYMTLANEAQICLSRRLLLGLRALADLLGIKQARRSSVLITNIS